MPDTLLESAVLNAPVDLGQALQIFQFNKLSPEQETLINASLEGKDTVGIMPTGSGKSACYQLPGIIRGERTLVISPLIALQQDQVVHLRQRGVHAYALNSGMSDPEKAAVHYFFRTAPRSCPAFLYLSPEMLLTNAFHSQFDGAGFTRLMIDEAHCVSTWGNAFRPDYSRIKVAAARLKTTVCGAYTATADARIMKDLRARLPLRTDCVVVQGNPYRENLKLSVEFVAGSGETRTVRYAKKRARLTELLVQDDFRGPTIIYYGSRRGVDTLQSQLADEPRLDIDFSIYRYHADMDPGDKVLVHKAFLEDERPVIVATTAFGMGVDRSNIRQVIHYHLPLTLLDYAQQIGRAGRDGKASLCTTTRIAGETLAHPGKPVMGTPHIGTVEKIHKMLRGTLAKKTREEARTYNIGQFQSYLQLRIEKSEKISEKRATEQRATTSLALLRKAGLIREDASGLTVLPLVQGTSDHEKLIELTQMHARMLWREQERIKEFFGASAPTQHLLWDILARG